MIQRNLLIASLAATCALAPITIPGRTEHASAQAAAGGAAAQTTQADAALIARVQSYLNGIKTLKARFLQVAPNGAISHGTVWLERPGRMRFQYDPPTPLLLIAGHGLVVFHNSKLNQTTNIPLNATPLGILLSDQISLSGSGVGVTGIRRLPGQIHLTLVRSARPSEGSLTLDFADTPLTLRQWTVVDAQGQRTTVELYDVQLGGSFPDSLFEYAAPMANPGRRGGGG